LSLCLYTCIHMDIRSHMSLCIYLSFRSACCIFLLLDTLLALVHHLFPFSFVLL
jgi:hypothetical protein